MRGHGETIINPQPYAIGEQGLSDGLTKTERALPFHQYAPGNDRGLGFDSTEDTVIFYDQASLIKLWNKPTWAIYATFSVVSKPFFHLLTISFIENNSIFPVVFSLLINKNETTYKKLFQILIDLNVRPTHTPIKTDFEQPSISAARSQFPNAKISGVHFIWDRQYGVELLKKV